MSAKITGQFQVSVFREDGSIRLKTPWFDNLVTNSGLNRIGVGTFLTHCSVGTGSEPPPEETNNSLVGGISTTTQIIASSSGASFDVIGDANHYYGFKTTTYKFDAGTATGNLAEVGIGWADGLFARSLLVDENGESAVITVLANEGLYVTYYLRNYAPFEEESFSAVVDSVTYSCVVKPALVTSGSTSAGWGILGDVITGGNITIYNGTMGAISGIPSGVSATVAGTTAAYVSNSYERSISGNWTTEEGNLAGGISAILLLTNGLGAYQMSLDPPIPKANTASLLLSFKVAWSRP